MVTEILDLLDNFNYRFISEFSSVQTCDFSTLSNHSSWECIKRLRISLITRLSSKWKETLQIDSFRSWINIFYVVKHEKRQNALHWFTTKLEFLIEDIYVEFRGDICQQLVLWKQNHYLWHISTYFDYLFVQVILNDTHRSCKFGRLLKVLSSITDMAL